MAGDGCLALMAGSRSWTTAAFLAVFALISAYSLSALAFSQDVRVELARCRGQEHIGVAQDERQAPPSLAVPLSLKGILGSGRLFLRMHYGCGGRPRRLTALTGLAARPSLATKRSTVGSG